MRLLKSLAGLVMTTREQIIKQTQLVARCEKSLALEKLKKRKADTRRKIELGGLVVKAGMAIYDKSILLGALEYTGDLIEQDSNYKSLFKSIGDRMFLN